MKKILFLGIVLIIIFIIYLCNIDKKVYYVALGNGTDMIDGNYNYPHYIKDYLKKRKVLEKYLDDFSEKNVKITDIINDINDNRKMITNKGNFTMKNVLIKADLVTISFDVKEVYFMKKGGFSSDEVYNYIDELVKDAADLFKLIRQYCKEDIIFIGFNGNDKFINYLNRRFKKICDVNDIEYVYVNDLKKNDFEKVANRVIKKIDKKVFMDK